MLRTFDFICMHLCLLERDVVVECNHTKIPPPTHTHTPQPSIFPGCLMDRVYWIFFLLSCFCASSSF